MRSSELGHHTVYTSQSSGFTAKKPAKASTADSIRAFPIRCLAADEDCSEIWAGAENEPSSLLNSSTYRQSLVLEAPAPATEATGSDFYKAEIKKFRAEIKKLEGALAQAHRLADEREEFVFFLQGKYKDKTSLEELRGERLLLLHTRIAELTEAMEGKDELILSLLAEKSELEHCLALAQRQFDEQTRELQKKVTTQVAVTEADRRERERCRLEVHKNSGEVSALEAALRLEREEVARLKAELRAQIEREESIATDYQKLYAKLNSLEGFTAVKNSDAEISSLEDENAELRALLEKEREENIAQLNALKAKVHLMQAAPTITLNKAIQTAPVAAQGIERGCQADTVSPLYKQLVAEALDFNTLASSRVQQKLDAPELLPTQQSLEVDTFTSSLRGICLALNSLMRRLCTSAADAGTLTEMVAAQLDASVLQNSALRQEIKKRERSSLKLYAELKEAKVDATRLAMEREELRLKLKGSVRTPRSTSSSAKTIVRLPQNRPFFELLTLDETFATFTALLRKVSDSDQFIQHLYSSEDMKTLLRKLFLTRR